MEYMTRNLRVCVEEIMQMNKWISSHIVIFMVLKYNNGGGPDLHFYYEMVELAKQNGYFYCFLKRCINCRQWYTPSWNNFPKELLIKYA